jgi:predicted transcriptional regulator
MSGMGKAKEQIRELLDKLPDDVSYEDVQYHIYVQQAVQRGIEAADRGEVISQEEVERRMAKWLGE